MIDWTLALPGQIIVDNSFSPPTQNQHAAGKQFGVVGNMRYSSDPSGNSKNLTREQVADAWAVGVGSMMNQEQTSLDSLDGYQGGVAKAGVFLRQADLIGMPRNIPAVVSIDTSWHPKALEYAMGFHDAMKGAGWEQTGCYFFGPGPCEQLLQAEVCSDLLWQAHAGSYWVLEQDAQAAAARAGGNCEVRRCPNRPGWEVIHNAAHCFQNFGYVKLSGGPYAPNQVDENEVRNPVRIWLPREAPVPLPPKPIIEEIPAMRVFDTDRTKTVVINGEMWWLPTDADVKQWLDATGQASPAPMYPWQWSKFYWVGPEPEYSEGWTSYKAEPKKLCRPRSTSNPTYVGRLDSVPGDIKLSAQ